MRRPDTYPSEHPPTPEPMSRAAASSSPVAHGASRNGASRNGASADDADASADYRERLHQQTLLAEEALPERLDDAMEASLEALRVVAYDVQDDGQDGGVGFQSVAVAAVQIIEQALFFEQEAAEAALSLGQCQMLASMTRAAEEAAAILRGTLSVQGARMMDVCAECPPRAAEAAQPWWFALTDALEVLEEGAEKMGSLTTAQPKDSPARDLSRATTQLLRLHHDALLREADQWIA